MTGEKYLYKQKNICLRKSEVSVEIISVDIIENLVEHGIHCLPYCCDKATLNEEYLWEFVINLYCGNQ